MLKEMYQGMNNAPMTILTSDLYPTDVTIKVADAAKLPDGPNYATVGIGDDAEVIFYEGKEGNTLTGVVRGFDSTVPLAWALGTKVYRAYTRRDHQTFIDNIINLYNQKLDSDGDGSRIRLGTGENAKLLSDLKSSAFTGNDAFTITLPASGWIETDGKQIQTITVTGATPGDFVYMPGPDLASKDAYAKAGVWLVEPTEAGNLTFTADKLPEADLTVNVVKMGW